MGYFTRSFALLIDAKNIHLKLSGHSILNGASLTIEKGKFYSLVGKNGAGKSTLVKILSGVYKKYEGEVFFEDENLNVYTTADLAKKISFMEQSLEAPEGMSLIQFMELHRYPYMKWSLSLDENDLVLMNHLLESLGLIEKGQQTVGSLSGGEWQKARLAGAIFQTPELLILDEPFSNLDPHIQDEIHQFLRKYTKKKGITTLMVSHDLNRSAIISDVMLGMKDGKIVENKIPKDFMSESTLERIYDSRFLMEKHPELDLKMLIPGSIQ